jgi:hypothetical protein
MPTPQELEACGSEAEDLMDRISTLLDGADLAACLGALMTLMRYLGEVQANPELRVLMARDLRELADIFQALDAAKH